MRLLSTQKSYLDRMGSGKHVVLQVHADGCRSGKQKYPLLTSNRKSAMKCCASLGSGASKHKHGEKHHHHHHDHNHDHGHGHHHHHHEHNHSHSHGHSHHHHHHEHDHGHHHSGGGCCGSTAEDTKLSKFMKSILSSIGILDFAHSLEHNSVAVIISTVALVLSGIVRYDSYLKNYQNAILLYGVFWSLHLAVITQRKSVCSNFHLHAHENFMPLLCVSIHMTVWIRFSYIALCMVT